MTMILATMGCCAPPVGFVLLVLTGFLGISAWLILTAGHLLRTLGQVFAPEQPLDEPKPGGGA